MRTKYYNEFYRVDNFARVPFHRFLVEKSVKKVENEWNYTLY